MMHAFDEGQAEVPGNRIGVSTGRGRKTTHRYALEDSLPGRLACSSSFKVATSSGYSHFRPLVGFDLSIAVPSVPSR